MEAFTAPIEFSPGKSLIVNARLSPHQLSHAPICKNNLMLFEEHCVKFYAKFVIDDPVGSRIFYL